MPGGMLGKKKVRGGRWTDYVEDTEERSRSVQRGGWEGSVVVVEDIGQLQGQKEHEDSSLRRVTAQTMKRAQ